MTAADIVTVILVLAGALLALTGAIGTHRFRDPFARMHAATKPVTLGLLLVTAGAAFQTTDSGDIVKLGLAAVLQLLTAPLGMHLLGRAAHGASLIDPATTIDDYAADNPPERPGE